MDAFRTHTAEDLAAGVFGDDWRRWPTAEGLEGPRLYGWARLRLFHLQAPSRDHWLLIRRSIADPTDMAFYVTFAPHVTELKELAPSPACAIFLFGKSVFGQWWKNLTTMEQ